RTGLDGQKPDAHRCCLRKRSRHFEHLRGCSSGKRSSDDVAAIHAHGFLPLDGAVDSSLTLCSRTLINPASELTRRLRFFRRNDRQQQVELFVAAEMQARDPTENAVRTIDWIVMEERSATGELVLEVRQLASARA